MKIKGSNSTYPTEMAFQKGCAETSASFQYGPDAIAACQECGMNKDVEGLLRELIRLKDILERMPTAFASINTNLSSGEKYVAGHQWIWWGKFSAPLSRRCPAASGLQFPPFLLMDALLQRKRYDSFLGREGLHLHAWLPTNLRALSLQLRITTAFPTSISRQETPGSWAFGKETWKRTRVKGFLGAHRYKVFGILGIASKTGRTETNGLSGAPDKNARPWEQPGDRLAVMPLNSWGECAKVTAALGLADYLDTPVALNKQWKRFVRHLSAVRQPSTTPQLTVRDILRRGYLAPITKELALKIHDML
ncbi:uncharacterized protein CTHT_0064480 [Thermochaetoides thermophila DSM 1495]|uniref:Uncharacterized protein n=1 Tax=Chaetomium thermophilum (strain DSM 1495 / CBS 144.50 / IMI 039719) TaxID=759272 RepID=G0SEP5_CHATD|nr:hypothetical protein CTHT_0064480 [Thermochaetoides thermophila DSM 1495]EGS18422.1 hypothetical protein CTHT_0064480 [Thermochaetoides thermophila DSM 1495]